MAWQRKLSDVIVYQYPNSIKYLKIYPNADYLSHDYDVTWASNPRELNCLLNRLFGLAKTETSKLRITVPLFTSDGDLKDQ